MTAASNSGRTTLKEHIAVFSLNNKFPVVQFVTHTTTFFPSKHSDTASVTTIPCRAMLSLMSKGSTKMYASFGSTDVTTTV